MSPREISLAVDRVRAEFTEMPGLRLTVPQAARLMGLDQETCEFVIKALEQGQFLRRTPTGLVARVEDKT
jgi:hypothetical protein